MAAAATVQAALTDQEDLQFYTDLWHCDVKKDHKQGYNQRIVSGFLPLGVPLPSRPGIEAPELFNRILEHEPVIPAISDLYGYFQNPGSTAGTTGTVKVRLFDKSLYSYQVFSHTAMNATSVGEICAATNGGGESVMFVDTHVHLQKIYAAWPTETPLYHAHSREIEMDPASKMSLATIGKPEMFYIEKAPPNPKAVLYPSFNKGDKLSYFFCRYPTYIVHNGVKGDNHDKLKVHFEYIKDDNIKIVKEKGNIAGAVLSLIKSAFACLSDQDTRYKAEVDSIEPRLLAKAHGDIAQTLTQFRPMILNNFGHPLKIINTGGIPHIFQSEDTNPISKAFSLGIDCIWMNTHDKKRLIVFTKAKDATELERILHERMKNARAKLEDYIIQAKSYLEDLKNKTASSEDKLHNFLIYKVPDEGSYKEYLKNYMTYAILSERVQSYFLGMNNLGLLKNHIDATLKEGEAKKVDPNTKVEDIEDINNEFHRILNTKSDLSWIEKLNVNPLPVLTTKELATIPKPKGRTLQYRDIFDCITIGEPEPTNKPRRIASTQIISSWGLDIIDRTYKRLSYDTTRATEFIVTLRTKVPADKQGEFDELLRSIKIPLPTPTSSGGYLNKTMKKKRNSIRKQRGGAIGKLKKEIRKHIDFLINIVYSSKFDDNRVIGYQRDLFDAEFWPLVASANGSANGSANRSLASGSLAAAAGTSMAESTPESTPYTFDGVVLEEGEVVEGEVEEDNFTCTTNSIETYMEIFSTEPDILRNLDVLLSFDSSLYDKLGNVPGATIQGKTEKLIEAQGKILDWEKKSDYEELPDPLPAPLAIGVPVDFYNTSGLSPSVQALGLQSPLQLKRSRKPLFGIRMSPGAELTVTGLDSSRDESNAEPLTQPVRGIGRGGSRKTKAKSSPKKKSNYAQTYKK